MGRGTICIMKRILVLEDEGAIREFIIINLKRVGYDVTEAASGEEALSIFEKDRGFDIAVLDVMLPGIDGIEVCKTLREKSSDIGIIILTAKSQELDKVTGIMSGADDYLTKPFSPLELIVRVDSLHRRVMLTRKAEKAENDKLELLVSGPFQLDNKSRTLSKNGHLLDLTQVEYLLVKFFLENPDTALSRENILVNVWGKDYIGDYKIVDVNMRRLRMKIEDTPSEPKFIQTLWGYGYKWVTNHDV